MIHNPVLPGFHPDPSVVRVGQDYFLATSTFVWQPGIRLFHSRDLASWRLVGHGLAAGRHDFRGLDHSAGIWAPDLSHDAATGTFHLTYSVMSSTTADYFDVDNYLVTAADIRGPWSAPSYLNSVGFDPSLFHDEDGRHWLVTLEWDPREGYQHPGAILLDEYHPATRSLTGPSRRIHRGATDRGCLEAPHLYRRDGWYYLMAAEGGTGYGHGVTLARSRELAGPYLPAPVNPFLTSNPAPQFGRGDKDHLRPALFAPGAGLQKAGHGCLVDTPDGEWYVAHLCARPLLTGPGGQAGLWCVLGRETAVQQVEWTDDGWLRLTAGGTVAQLTTAAPRSSRHLDGDPAAGGSAVAGAAVAIAAPVTDHFDGPALDPRYSTLRRAATPDWLTVGGDRPGLRLRGGQALSSRADVSLVATPLLDFRAVAETSVEVAPQHFSHSAGLVVYYDATNFAYARCYRSESLGSAAVGVVVVSGGVKRELLLHRAATPPGAVLLQARIDAGALQFWWSQPGGELRPLGPVLDATFMSDEATRGFTGTMLGLACVDAYRRDLLARFGHLQLRHGGDVPQFAEPAPATPG